MWQVVTYMWQVVSAGTHIMCFTHGIFTMEVELLPQKIMKSETGGRDNNYDNVTLWNWIILFLMTFCPRGKPETAVFIHVDIKGTPSVNF